MCNVQTGYQRLFVNGNHYGFGTFAAGLLVRVNSICVLADNRGVTVHVHLQQSLFVFVRLWSSVSMRTVCLQTPVLHVCLIFCQFILSLFLLSPSTLEPFVLHIELSYRRLEFRGDIKELSFIHHLQYFSSEDSARCR